MACLNLPSLLHLIPYEGQVSGIAHKISCQIVALSEGYDVTQGSIIPSSAPLLARIVIQLSNELRWSFSAFKYANIYYRYSPACPILNLLLSLFSFFARTKIWVEYNGWYCGELRHQSRLLLYFHYISIFILRRTNVTHLPVTEEIGRLEGLKDFRVLGNGYSAPTEKAPGKANQDLQQSIQKKKELGNRILIFVASKEAPWHGVDRILALLNKLKNTYLILVGDIEPHDIIPSLERKGKLLCTGPLPAYTLRKLYPFVDIGLGSFAETRRGLEQAVTLKVREYLFNGLPCIIGHKDPLAVEGWTKNYLFEVQADPIDPNHISEIIESTIRRENMCHIAQNKLSWKCRFQAVGLLP